MKKMNANKVCGFSLFLFHNRHPMNHNLADDFLTQTWFIVVLVSMIVIIIFSFVAMVLIKRIQFIKQTSLTNIHGTYKSFGKYTYAYAHNIMLLKFKCLLS